MLGHVLAACRAGGVQRFCIVVGYGKDMVIDEFGGDASIEFVEQKEQLGTGHAVQMCLEVLKGFTGDVVIIAGDMPLVRPDTIATLIDSHRETGAALTLATSELSNPTGYGRIIRDAAGRLKRIVEERDCDDMQRVIRETNPGYYCFDSGKLVSALGRLKNDNAKKEYYLTDTVGILIGDGETVEAVTAVPEEDAVGANSRHELATINALMRDRILARLMDEGVTIVDPASTWVHAEVTIGADTVIEPFCVIEEGATIGGGCRVGPFAHVSAGATVADGMSVGGCAEGTVSARG
jgi:bifunctional UDP-N-acetylglucosamine pyrophosphorylase/glucosamine-1-phosphate N-acetyltransferase